MATIENRESTAAASERRENDIPLEHSSGQATSERVAVRAFELFQARGATDGQDVNDWLQAEREISGANGASADALGERGRSQSTGDAN